MTALTALGQARAHLALAALAESTPGLPAADIHVRGHITLTSMITVEVVAHHEPDVFEAWRDALGIEEVDERRLSFGGWVTSGHAIVDGIAFVLTLHHRQPAPAYALAGAA
ncbi:hypothetical protein [Streptomyces sparsogenes]|uniref:hypothetical protein n=1 Tax=Streptomyces sparsogenes TaxID=67365 RepID=UPI003407CE16